MLLFNLSESTFLPKSGLYSSTSKFGLKLLSYILFADPYAFLISNACSSYVEYFC